MNKNNNTYWTLAAYIMTVLFAGFNAIGVHYTVLELPPFWGAALRFGPASAFLFLVVIFFKLPLPHGRALLGTILYGALNFGATFAFLYFGLIRVQPGMATVMLALVPLFTLLFAILHKQETFRWRALLGALLALGGIGLVFVDQLRTNVPILYLAAVILGSVCFAEANVIAKSFPKSHPITTSAVGMAAGTIILLLVSILARENRVLPVKAPTWFALIFLIILGSCAVFTLTLFVLKRWSASTISYQFVLLPFITLTVSAWLIHETLSPILLAGAGLVLAGVFFGVLFTPKKREVQQPSIARMDGLEQPSAADC
jgi:drug/metabolite transporter (DMT)-like permease